MVITSASHTEGPGFNSQMNLLLFIKFTFANKYTAVTDHTIAVKDYLPCNYVYIHIKLQLCFLANKFLDTGICMTISVLGQSLQKFDEVASSLDSEAMQEHRVAYWL